MKKREILEIEGIVDVFAENGEASITVFEEKDGFIDEIEYDMIKILEKFQDKTVSIKIECNSRGVE